MPQETLILTLKSQNSTLELVALMQQLLEPLPVEWAIKPSTPTLGVITGTMVAISGHHGHKFTLVDTLTQQTVTCFFEPAQMDLIQSCWGKSMRVTGLIWRDVETGYPLTLSQVYQIEPLVGQPAYAAARGIIAQAGNDEQAEISIRRLRDGL